MFLPQLAKLCDQHGLIDGADYRLKHRSLSLSRTSAPLIVL